MLTPAEQRTFSLIFLTDPQIADLLNISFRTVGRYVEKMKIKLGVHTRVGVLRGGLELGYKIDEEIWDQVEEFVERSA